MPLRIEIGPRDVEKGEVVLARRDQPGREGKSSIPLAGISEAVNDTLNAIQSALLQRATNFRDENTSEATDHDQLKAAVTTGFARAWWCGKPSCEDQVKTDTQATIRCMPLDQPGGGGKCIVCGESAKEITVFARAY